MEVTEDYVGCGVCQKSCFVNAIQLVNGKAEINDERRGCGRCIEAFPEHAITISIPDLMAIDKTIWRIENVINVK